MAFVNKHMDKVSAIYVDSSEIKEKEKILNERFRFAKKVTGCRSMFKYQGVAGSSTQIKCSVHSRSEEETTITVYKEK